MILIPINLFYVNYFHFNIAEEDTKVCNRMVVIHAWVKSIITVGLLTLTSIGLWSLILGALIGISLALLYGCFSIDQKGWVAGLPSKQVSVSLVRYAGHFYLAGLFGQLQKTGTSLLAVAYLLPAQLAFLSQALGLGQLLNKLVDPVSTICFPVSVDQTRK